MAVSQELQGIVEIIQELSSDNTIPQSVRAKLQVIKSHLIDESCEIAIRINKVMDDLEQISNDSNIPSYTRTEIWNLTSLLETIQ